MGATVTFSLYFTYRLMMYRDGGAYEGYVKLDGDQL